MDCNKAKEKELQNWNLTEVLL